MAKPSSYTPSLYVGGDGKLRGGYWDGQTQPLVSSVSVNDGNWHHVVLTGTDGQNFTSQPSEAGFTTSNDFNPNNILVTDAVFNGSTEYDAVHMNSEFDEEQQSDHDPPLARFRVTEAPARD